MKRFWDKYAPYWHICTALLTGAVFAVLWFNQVQGYDARITDNKEQIDKQGNTLTRLDYNVQFIAEKIGVVPLKPSFEEGK